MKIKTPTTIRCFLEYFSNNIMNHLPFSGARLFFYRHFMGLRAGKDTYISMRCDLIQAQGIEIGANCAINQGCYLDGRGKLKIADNVNIGREVYIYTAEHDHNSRDFRYEEKSVEINEDAWIASNSVIIPGVRIGRGAVVAAGSVVTKDVEPYAVVGGNPAKFIKRRTQDLRYKTKWSPLFY